MKKGSAAILGVFALLLAFAPAALASPECATKECHAKLMDNKYVHGPVGAFQCDACHVKVGEHKFKLAKDNVGDLCYECHDRMDTKEHVHGPVASGDCTGCHSPHSSPYKFQLAGEGANLCFKCHNDDKVKQKFVHGPVAAGDCIACHDPHTSPNNYQLLAPGNDLCFTCHVDKKDEFAAGKYPHPPVIDRCNNCHNAHGTPYKYQLAKAVPDLCFSSNCHDKMQESISKAKVQHKPVVDEKGCVNCHQPHVSNFQPLLKAGGSDLCLACHRTSPPPAEMAGAALATNLMDMKAWFDANPDKHGPARNGDCNGCHMPHGGDNMRLVIDSYPTEFYAPYSTDKYAMCFSCHNKDIAIDEFTTTLTNFRNGDKNEHFVHVNKNPKGRTCRACHEVHAGKQPNHVREKVPFGKLSYPIRFTKTQNGGSCIVGCHVERGYDRTNPVKNK